MTKTVHVVMKAPVGLDDIEEFIGVFDTAAQANAACIGAGTYRIAEMELGRIYRTGQLQDVVVRRVMGEKPLRT